MASTPQTKTTRAAIYTRVSTEDQKRNTSLDEQARKCREEATRRGWEVVAEYQDAGISGTRSDRPAWQAMQSDARLGKLDTLVVLNLSRFSRNSGDTITQARALLELGVSLVSVQESFDVSMPSGRAMLGMQAVFWEFDRDQIVEKTVNGQRAKADANTWPGGTPPFGWHLDGHKETAHPVPDEREREIIRLAYELLIDKRMNVQQVCDRLNDLDLMTRQAHTILVLGKNPRGLKPNKWNPDVLRRMVTNPSLHTGEITWGALSSPTTAYYSRSHHTKPGRDGKPKYGDPVQISLGDTVVTAQEYRAALRAIKRRSTRGKSLGPVSQMLTTRIVGECGKHYIGVTISNKDYDVYRCTGRKHNNRPNKCACSQVHAGALDDRVWDQIKQKLGDSAWLDSMARMYLELPARSDDNDGTIAAVTGIDRQIAKLEVAQGNAARELLLSANPEPLRVALADVEREMVQLRSRRDAYAAFERAAQDKAEAVTDLVALAERARGRLEVMPAAARREIMEILDIRVTITGRVVSRQPERISEPESILITGKIDPRMFGDGDSKNSNEDAGPRPGFSGSGTSADGDERPRAAGFSGPSNSGSGDERRHRVLGRGRPALGQQPSLQYFHQSTPVSTRVEPACGSRARGTGAPREPVHSGASPRLWRGGAGLDAVAGGHRRPARAGRADECEPDHEQRQRHHGRSRNPGRGERGLGGCRRGAGTGRDQRPRHDRSAHRIRPGHGRHRQQHPRVARRVDGLQPHVHGEHRRELEGSPGHRSGSRIPGQRPTEGVGQHDGGRCRRPALGRRDGAGEARGDRGDPQLDDGRAGLARDSETQGADARGRREPRGRAIRVRPAAGEGAGRAVPDRDVGAASAVERRHETEPQFVERVARGIRAVDRHGVRVDVAERETPAADRGGGREGQGRRRRHARRRHAVGRGVECEIGATG